MAPGFGGSNGPTYFELRVPAFAEAGMPSAVIVQAIGGGRTDPCAATSATRPIALGPQAVMEYLETIPHLEVTNEAASTVGGLPARQAMVKAGVGTPTCPQLWPWATSPESEPFPGGRVILVDVSGEHLALTVYGEDVNPAWDTMADGLIGSFRFLPAASPPASPAPS